MEFLKGSIKKLNLTGRHSEYFRNKVVEIFWGVGKWWGAEIPVPLAPNNTNSTRSIRHSTLVTENNSTQNLKLSIPIKLKENFHISCACFHMINKKGLQNELKVFSLILTYSNFIFQIFHHRNVHTPWGILKEVV